MSRDFIYNLRTDSPAMLSNVHHKETDKRDIRLRIIQNQIHDSNQFIPCKETQIVFVLHTFSGGKAVMSFKMLSLVTKGG